VKSLKPVTMYQCQHCKKLFKTPDKHNCRRDPDKTNCYTCEHWLHQFYIDWGGGETEPTCDPSDACKMHETSIVEEAHAIMRERDWCLNCPDYKLKA
jgi:hypothetical protein